MKNPLILLLSAALLLGLAACSAPPVSDAQNDIASTPRVLLTDEQKKDAIAGAQSHSLGRYFDDEEGLKSIIEGVVDEIIVNYKTGVYPPEGGNPAIDPLPEGLALPEPPFEWEQFIDAQSGWDAPSQQFGTKVYEASLTLPLEGWDMHFYFPVIHGDDLDVSVTKQLPANCGHEVRFTPQPEVESP